MIPPIAPGVKTPKILFSKDRPPIMAAYPSLNRSTICVPYSSLRSSISHPWHIEFLPWNRFLPDTEIPFRRIRLPSNCLCRSSDLLKLRLLKQQNSKMRTTTPLQNSSFLFPPPHSLRVRNAFLYRPIKGANSPSVYLDKAADDKQPAHAHVAHFGEGDLLGAVHSL